VALLEILTIPDPRLKTAAVPVRAVTPPLRLFIADLVETLHHHPFCVGIAAPQAGVGVRVIVIDASRGRKPCENHGPLVLINPVVALREDFRVGREGCLSVPGLTGNVSRAQKAVVDGFDIDMDRVSVSATGFEAVVLQHELDHLDGFLFLDRVASLKTDVFRRMKTG
jgi:peptide deformylase